MRIEYKPSKDSATIVADVLSCKDGTAREILCGVPIRKPMAYHGQSSKPGFYWMASTGQHVSFESKFERTILVGYDWSGTVRRVLPQPLRLYFERTARPYRHVPDFLFELVGDEHELVDVKGARARQKPLNSLTFTLTARAADLLGWAFTVATEPVPVRAANIAYFAGYRTPKFAPIDQHIPTLLNILRDDDSTVAGVFAALEATGIASGVVPAVVWRAAWKRLVFCDINRPMTMASALSLSDDTLECVR
ncbi:MAG: TnsA-like heteromeric transposase endonuclease subunit [Actinomycetes bacterium]